MKYGTKNTKESNKDCKSYGTIDLSFKLKLTVFFISKFHAQGDQIVSTVSYFFRTDVVMETLRMKYGTKKDKGEQQRL